MNLSNVIQRKVENMSRNYTFNKNVIAKQSLKHSQSFSLSGTWLQEWRSARLAY